MKKAWSLLIVIPFLCGCSGRQISSEDAYRMMTNFEDTLDKTTTFAFYERKAITETSSSKTTTLYQVFFEKNFIHSYTVNEDSDVNENNSAVENWVFIDDGMIYEVTTEGAEESKKGKVYEAVTYEKEVWEARMKDAFEEIKTTNRMYIFNLKNQLKTPDKSTTITSYSNSDEHLREKVETRNSDNKVIKTTNYTFENSLISEIVEKDDYSKKSFYFSYQITTQEPNIPDF